jgi:hypothetical protein
MAVGPPSLQGVVTSEMKITEKIVEAGVRAEWAAFTGGAQKWPDSCPPSARERWRRAFRAGLTAAIRAESRSKGGKR